MGGAYSEGSMVRGSLTTTVRWSAYSIAWCWWRFALLMNNICFPSVILLSAVIRNIELVLQKLFIAFCT